MGISLRQRVMTGLSAFVLVVGGLVGFVPVANAATANTQYSYKFGSSTTTVTNDAAANSGVNLNLVGNVSVAAGGDAIRFVGDTTSQMSVGYALPSSGSTLAATASESYGFAFKFKHEIPTGQTCFPDSKNYAQIGRNGTGLSQFKLQTSACNQSSTAVYPECRVAGSASAPLSPVVRGTQGLVNGDTYIIRCIKHPDTVSATGPITLITDRQTSTGYVRTTDTFNSHAATGAFNSTAYLSVANKYTLPAQSANTDQFVGDVYKFSVCKASTVTSVETCLDTDNPNATSTPDPDPVPSSTPTQYVTNQGIETNTTGWTGVWGSNVTITRDTTQARTGTASLKAVYTGTATTNAGIKDDPIHVTNAIQGKTYTGSVWVKAPVNKTLNLKIRELNSSGTEIGSWKESVVANSAGWVQVSTDYTATQNGTSISFGVYAYSSPSTTTFWADDFSLTTPSNTIEHVTNKDIETNTTGWNGVVGSDVTTTRDTTQARTGTASLKAVYTGTATTNAGVKDDPLQVTNTEQGKTYTGSVWVKAPVNKTLNLKIRELDVNGNELSSHKESVVANSAGWTQITTAYTAIYNGSGLSFSVYAYSDPTTTTFWADDFSLTSPNTTQYVTNQGIETNTTGWTGVWGSNVTITRDIAEAHTGAASLKAVYTGSSTTNAGIKDAPVHVASAIQGKTYTGSVWVKAPVNKTLNLKIRELNSSGTEIGSWKESAVATSTGWIKISTNYTATQTGSAISFGLYAYSSPTTTTFWADDFSLTVAN